MRTTFSRNGSILTRTTFVMVALILAACGSAPSLDEEALSDLRSSNDLEGYSDEDIRTVADNLCQSIGDSDTGDSDGLLDAAWAEVGAAEVGLEELVASLDIIDAACPDALTPELAADSEPIPISFTLLGSDGDDFTYSEVSGCQGEGGYGDIREGMLFNLTDERGDVLGVARLDNSDLSSLGCEVSGAFAVTFGELDDESLYLVGDRAGRRGELAYTGSELKAQGSIDLSLGD